MCCLRAINSHANQLAPLATGIDCLHSLPVLAQPIGQLALLLRLLSSCRLQRAAAHGALHGRSSQQPHPCPQAAPKRRQPLAALPRQAAAALAQKPAAGTGARPAATAAVAAAQREARAGSRTRQGDGGAARRLLPLNLTSDAPQLFFNHPAGEGCWTARQCQFPAPAASAELAAGKRPST